jgi:hypothetical protein
LRKWRRRLAQAVELPESAFGPCPCAVLEGNGALRVDECLEILRYDESEIGLRLRGMILTVSGEGLTMRSYAAGTVRIIGVIRSLSLGDSR